MDSLELTQSARLSRDESGNDIVILPLPVWEALLDEMGVEYPHVTRQTLDNLAPLHVGVWPDGLELISRDDYYGDDGR